VSDTNGSGVKARARIDVMLKPEIADPQGRTVEKALPTLGWENVSDVRVGKHLELLLEGASLDALREQVEAMCERFLTNPVIESYTVTLDPA
jgi:phosphoribosylformylglycinamidine synthase subunit PurS